MSVEVRIPKEITDYKEKIMFGLSIRQLISVLVSMPLGIGTYIFLSLKWGMNITGYIVIIEVMPILAFGFLRIKGFTLEKIMKYILKHKLGVSRRKYKVNLHLNYVGVDKNVEYKDKKRLREKNKEKREYEGFEPKKERRKENIKNIKQQIKRVKKEGRRKNQR